MANDSRSRNDIRRDGTFEHIQVANADTLRGTHCSPSKRNSITVRKVRRTGEISKSWSQTVTKETLHPACIFAVPVPRPDHLRSDGENSSGISPDPQPREFWRLSTFKGQADFGVFRNLLSQEICDATQNEFYVTDEWRAAQPFSKNHLLRRLAGSQDFAALV